MNATAAHWAREQVEQVRDDPWARLELTARTYQGPRGYSPAHLPFRQAALSFMRWQHDRGVLAPLNTPAPGSPWWRACNERLLRDGCEAVARSGGRGGATSSPSIGVWMAFVAHPTSATWYRAHNTSIVAAYLDHRELAEQESMPERFFLNVTLMRVLYAHALSAAPRLALGWLAPLSRIVGNPRLGAVGIFLSLRRILPDQYPLDRETQFYLRGENGIGKMLDYGMIVPRMDRLYEWSARELDEPRLQDLYRDGRPSYAWSDGDADVWNPPQRHQLMARVARRVIPAS